MDVTLRGAAQDGDTNELYNCIRGYADVLRGIDEADFVDTPLHIAAAEGHTDFAMALMYLKPSLARKLNQDICSPMHLALQNDRNKTVLGLLAVDKDLVRVKGKEGYTPLHHVVREGKLDLLAQFLKDCPACIEDVTIKNETAFHIAAQNNRLEALEMLARWIQRTDIHGKVSRKHVLDLKDRDGNTVLHIAAANTQPQMIKLLLECDVDTKKTNMGGLTAFNVLESQSISDNRDISLEILCPFYRRYPSFLRVFLNTSSEPLQKALRSKITLHERAISGLLNMSPEKINALLVVAVLILTATYQAMLTPPTGVFLGDISGNDSIAKVGTTAEEKISFRTFLEINYIVFLYTSFVTVALLQIAISDSGIMVVIIEVLLSCLTSGLVMLMREMVPSSTPWEILLRSSVVYNSMPWVVAIAVFLIMETGRMLPQIITTHRRVKYFKKIFREL